MQTYLYLFVMYIYIYNIAIFISFELFLKKKYWFLNFVNNCLIIINRPLIIAKFKFIVFKRKI